MTDKDSYEKLIADMRLAAKAERERRYDMDPQITDADADEWANRLAALSQPGEVTDEMAVAGLRAYGVDEPNEYQIGRMRAALSEALGAQTRKVAERRKAVLTAPERIWLQISEDEDHYNEPFPHHVGEEVTWCQESVLACEVPYVRADLAAIGAQTRGERELLGYLYADDQRNLRQSGMAVIYEKKQIFHLTPKQSCIPVFAASPDQQKGDA